jgi:hypothetical protein
MIGESEVLKFLRTNIEALRRCICHVPIWAPPVAHVKECPYRQYIEARELEAKLGEREGESPMKFTLEGTANTSGAYELVISDPPQEWERERCARIAEGMPIAALNVPPEVKGVIRQHVARIAARIRSGEE